MTNDDGYFDIDLPSEKVALTATNGHGFAFVSTLEANRANVDINLSGKCFKTAGRLRSDQSTPGTAAVILRFEKYSENSGDAFGALVDEHNDFELCVPSGDYNVVTPGNIISQRTTVTIPGQQLELPVTTRQAAFASPRSIDGLVEDKEESFLRTAVESAQLIGFGETNHGSSEFATERTRLSMILAERYGIEAILLEAGFGEALALDSYVQGATLDIAAAVKRLGYWTWSTSEFIDSLNKIRAYNESLPTRPGLQKKIHVVGVDIQTGGGAIEYLLAQATSDLGDSLGLLELLSKDTAATWKHFATDQQKVLIDRLRQIANKRTPGGLSSKQNIIALAAHSLVLYLEYLGAVNGADNFRKRDQGMSTLALEVLNLAPDLRAVFWAHLAHIARSFTVGSPSTGAILASSLGRRYRIYALLAAGGAVKVRDQSPKNEVTTVALPDLPATSLETLLSSKLATSRPQLSFWTFDQSRGEARQWLNRLRFVRSFGAVYPGIDQSLLLYDLSSIDGAILFGRVTPSTLVPR